MTRRPFYEMQRYNPARKPTWRWDRAHDLVDSGRYFSKKRDDTGTGIAVAYLRDLGRCCSDLRLRRVRKRYRHVYRARGIWESRDGRRLEAEARLLARQNDVEIGLEMSLPAATVQAYRDLFFHMGDRLDAAHYVLYSVIGIRPGFSPPLMALMQSAAYFRGPAVIEPWLHYLRGDREPTNLTSEAGGTRAKIDLLVAAHSLPDTPETRQSLVKLAPMLFQNGVNKPQSGSVGKAFTESTSRIIAGLGLPTSAIAPFSYAPTSPQQLTDPIHAHQRDTKWAA